MFQSTSANVPCIALLKDDGRVAASALMARHDLESPNIWFTGLEQPILMAGTTNSVVWNISSILCKYVAGAHRPPMALGVAEGREEEKPARRTGEVVCCLRRRCSASSSSLEVLVVDNMTKKRPSGLFWWADEHKARWAISIRHPGGRGHADDVFRPRTRTGRIAGLSWLFEETTRDPGDGSAAKLLHFCLFVLKLWL
ncbi:hypothetical protein ACP4OV_016986 [Aristida adscensionis]